MIIQLGKDTPTEKNTFQVITGRAVKNNGNTLNITGSVTFPQQTEPKIVTFNNKSLLWLP